jgi:hypothetical protein
LAQEQICLVQKKGAAAKYSRLAAAALMGTVGTVIGAWAGEGFSATHTNGNDGTYTVNIVTHQGTILVSGGRVSSAGDTPMEASGQINSGGGVRLRFQRFGDVADVSGRLAKGAGSGTWTSSTLQCSGSWRATRRG